MLKVVQGKFKNQAPWSPIRRLLRKPCWCLVRAIPSRQGSTFFPAFKSTVALKRRQFHSVPRSPGKSQKEGQKDQGTLKQQGCPSTFNLKYIIMGGNFNIKSIIVNTNSWKLMNISVSSPKFNGNWCKLERKLKELCVCFSAFRLTFPSKSP